MAEHSEARSLRELMEAAGRAAFGGLDRGWKKGLADELGISAAHFSRLLAGERLPSVRLLSRIRAIADGSTPHGEPEIDCMASLAGLTDEQRNRVLAWAFDRWGSDG